MRPSQQAIPKWSHYSRLAATDKEEEQAGDYGSEHSLEGAAAEDGGTPDAAAAAATRNRTATTKGEESPLIIRDEEDGRGGEKNQSSSVARKVGVAVSGAALTGLGLVMIPLPTPFGCVVAASGMAVLGTEFPAAQKVLDQTLDATVDVLERNCDGDGEGEQETQEERQEDEGGVANKDKPITCQQEQYTIGKIRSASNAATAKLKQSAKMLGRKAIPILKKLGSEVKDDDDKEV